ncbi:MAG: M48 family metallopeptidase [Thermovenabulum sp.]|uniref:M48 family metallopeptidase n=1 Tax=Thermovenabulum sp. TaxID=3100335 RepID=UPI003C7BD281
MEIKIEKIIRSKRKTIGLQVTDNGALIVRAPFEVSEDVIWKVIYKHKNWIDKKKREIEKRDPKILKKEFVNGEGFLYLGRYYKLHIIDNQEEPLRFENGFYLSKDALSNAKEVFIDWYKKAAYEKISERVKWYAQKCGFQYNKINITNAERRWGSCSYKGNLNFSWRLIMAPLPVIDYVVVHELAHLRIKNHSKSFWAKVKSIMPVYEKHEKWLKENGYLLKL